MSVKPRKEEDDLTENGRPSKLGNPPKFKGASGWTPVENTFPTFPVSNAGLTDLDKARIKFQRRKLFGFTTLELQDLDVITTRPLRPGNLSNKLFYLFERDRWAEELPSNFTINKPYPLPTPLQGNCKHPVAELVFNTDLLGVAKNDVVWDAIEPSLRLASHIISNVHMMPWVSL